MLRDCNAGATQIKFLAEILQCSTHKAIYKRINYKAARVYKHAFCCIPQHHID